jgi:DMSO/TMAO reductase YedYZ molybdopterin-dependent catalytic subunit
MTVLKDLGTPVFHAEGIPNVDSKWMLDVTGLVRRPQSFDLEKIKALPGSTVVARLTSVSGFSVRASWDGVIFPDFVKTIQPTQDASHATFTSIGGYDSTLSLVNLAKPKVMLCYGVGGDPLDPEYGGPLRLLVPHLWGYKSVKWLSKIDFTDRMKGGYWEDRGHTREAEIEPGLTLDVNTGTRRRISGGAEVTDF